MQTTASFSPPLRQIILIARSSSIDKILCVAYREITVVSVVKLSECTTPRSDRRQFFVARDLSTI